MRSCSLESNLSTENDVSDIIQSNKLSTTDENELSRQLSKREGSLCGVIKNLIEKEIIIQIGSIDRPRYFHKANFLKFKNEVVTSLEKHHKRDPFSKGLTKKELKNLISNKKNQKSLDAVIFEMILEELQADSSIKFNENYIHLPGFQLKKDENESKIIDQLKEKFYSDLRGDRYQTISVENMKENYSLDLKKCFTILKIAETEDQIERISLDLFAASSFINKIRLILCGAHREGRSLKATNIVQLVHSSRKKVVPVLEYLDGINFSRREGDFRIINENKCQEVS